MKKLLFSAAIMGLLFTASCNKDDDGGGKNCETCKISMSGSTISTEYCDNGNGTMQMTVNGQTETVDLEGMSFDEYIKALRASGMCN